MKLTNNLGRSRTTIVCRGIIVPVLLLALWQLLSTLGPQYAYAFVPLQHLAHSAVALISSGELLLNIRASLWVALQSLLTGGSIGLVLGLLMVYWRWLDLALGPVYHTLRQIPTMGLIPLIGLWFGNTETAKLIIVSLATFEVMLLNSYEGLTRVEPRYRELASSLSLSKAQLFRYVLLPGATASIMTGVFHAVAFAWLATVGVELLFTVGPGISVIMERAQLAERMDVVIICITTIGLLGFAMNQFCVWLARRLLAWRPS
ncbi:ABC transporter permease [Rheinheimera muenzenbergensis]|uniref:ABC transporter permease n=1 Tax=Rheinheimera muenzenbergensis TaxID=1193628 RepID=A0ABU8C3Y3_9GAMM